MPKSTFFWQDANFLGSGTCGLRYCLYLSNTFFAPKAGGQLLEGSRVGRGSAGTEKARLKATKLVLVAREGRRGKQETNKRTLIWVKSSVLLAYIALGE